MLRFHAIPVLSVYPGEFEQIAARAAEQPRPDDPVERELDELRDKLLTLQTLAEMPAPMALEMLVARAQRKRQ